MKHRKIIIQLLCTAMLALGHGASATDHRPTCKDRPELRDCVKVEDPDAAPPKPSVYRNPAKPGGPVARPLPAGPGPRAK